MAPDVMKIKWRHHEDLAVSINDAAPCHTSMFLKYSMCKNKSSHLLFWKLLKINLYPITLMSIYSLGNVRTQINKKYIRVDIPKDAMKEKVKVNSTTLVVSTSAFLVFFNAFSYRGVYFHPLTFTLSPPPLHFGICGEKSTE